MTRPPSPCSACIARISARPGSASRCLLGAITLPATIRGGVGALTRLGCHGAFSGVRVLASRRVVLDPAFSLLESRVAYLSGCLRHTRTTGGHAACASAQTDSGHVVDARTFTVRGSRRQRHCRSAAVALLLMAEASASTVRDTAIRFRACCTSIARSVRPPPGGGWSDCAAQGCGAPGDSLGVAHPRSALSSPPCCHRHRSGLSCTHQHR